MESFFATLKIELVHHEEYETRAAAGASPFESIEVSYYRKRRHSALGDVSPGPFAEAASPALRAIRPPGGSRNRGESLSP